MIQILEQINLQSNAVALELVELPVEAVNHLAGIDRLRAHIKSLDDLRIVACTKCDLFQTVDGFITLNILARRVVDASVGVAEQLGIVFASRDDIAPSKKLAILLGQRLSVQINTAGTTGPIRMCKKEQRFTALPSI